ncbi:MAG: DUF3164 family protein [Desulfobacterium sp.]|nr:DUF3164 family protein [Desulfobacterium sp.]
MAQAAIELKDYMTDPQGRLVPIDLVKEIDKSRDGLVHWLVKNAKDLQERMVTFKKDSMSEVKAFVDLSARDWDVELGGKKGNLTLMSFDARYKVQLQVAEFMVFDEQLKVAKEMIDQCINKWTEGSRSEIKALINDAFQVDKEGRINTKRILSLRRLDIKDELWLRAMDAITSSLKVVGSKEYIRIYERDKNDQWHPISLDLAAL